MRSLAMLPALLFSLTAQSVAQVLPPPPLPPPPINTTQQALNDAYAAVVRANAANAAGANSAAASQAGFLYALALSRYRAGDRSSATYDAALAAGLANASLARTFIPLAAPVAPPPGYLFPTRPVPLPAALPSELLRARNEIERLQVATGKPLAAATALYRGALDRYFAGDVAGARSEADAALNAARSAAKPHSR
jgi:hypothetical protein